RYWSVTGVQSCALPICRSRDAARLDVVRARTARRPSRLLHGAGWAGAGAADVLVLDVEYASSVCATKDRDPEYEDRPGLDQHARSEERRVGNEWRGRGS